MRPLLETTILHHLRKAWEQVNYDFFRGVMLPPVLELRDTPAWLGRWHHPSRTIALSRRLVVEQPWLVVIEVLKHEMAHQYAHEVLLATDEQAHGPAFQKVCARLGIDPASDGLPAAPGVAEEDRVLRRTRRLLALAESPNEHEAQAAARAAQRLMLMWNIEIEAAPRAYSFRQVGTPRPRIEAHERVLAGLLARHYFVEVIWAQGLDTLTGRDGQVLELAGTPANLEMACYVHSFLLETAERLWRQHKTRLGIPGNRERRRYLTGVMVGFREKLDEQGRQNQEEGLVWVGDPQLSAWFDMRHPRTRTIRAGSAIIDETFTAGRSAGRDIVLHRPVTAGPGALAGRLLQTTD